MSARAEAAAETGRRILAAMQALFIEHPYDELTLAMVAHRAGVTLQTVLRRFGSKDGLLAAAAEEGRARIVTQRAEAPAGDVTGAVRNVFDHYEEWGRLSLRLLEQEDRVPQIGAFTREGRDLHAAWVERVFADALRGRRGSARTVRHAQLVALTDVYLWKLLRIDRGLPRPVAERAVTEMIEALLARAERA